MFFTYAARIMAVPVFVYGVLQVLVAVAMTNNWTGSPYVDALTSFTTVSSSSDAMEKAVYNLAVALALGTLAEIALMTRAKLDE